jgi:CheY-like chemotaxis protein
MANILLVDLTPDLQAPLEAAGHTVTLATDGRMALERLKDHSFDLIVTELFLPEVDGFELLRWTENQPPPVPKVIAMTAGTAAMPVMPALLLAKAQAAATLPRPFEPAQLLGAIAAVVSPVAELIDPPAIRAR